MSSGLGLDTGVPPSSATQRGISSLSFTTHISLMDDLSGLSWSAPPASNANKPPPPPKPNTLSSNVFANLPIRPSTTSPGPSKFNRTQPSTGAVGGGDSFANLVSFGRNKQSTGNLSLQEQQRRLQEQKANEEKERRKKIDALFGGGGSGDAAAGFWDSLESGKGTGVGDSTAASRAPPVDEDEDDLLAAFNASVPVDNSSHYPPPAPSPVPRSHTSTPRNGTPNSHFQDLIGESAFLGPNSYTPAPRNGTPGSHLQDLMGDSAPGYTKSGPLDPFDIGSLPSRTTPANNVLDDDDILGDLAKPVSELPPRPKPTAPIRPQELEDMPSMSSKPISDPRDPVIAEIMDMGFTAAQAKRALHETDSLDLRTAVGWLLEDAHKKSRPTSSQPMPRTSSNQGQRGKRPDEGGDAPRRRREEGRDDSSTPAWARDRSRDPDGEKDLGALAQEIGGTLFKSANSLWNTGKKKVEKAIAEFQTEGSGSDGGDPNMPKWMRDQQMEASVPARGRERGNRFHEDDVRPAQRAPQAPEPILTEEAMMLEAGSGPPPRRRQEMDTSRSSSATPAGLGLSEREMVQRQRQHALEQAIRDKERDMRERERPKPVSSIIPNSTERNRKLTRSAVEEDSATQYVSHNRRRPPPPPAASNIKPATPELPQGDLLFGGGSAPREQSRNPFQQQNPTPIPARRQNPTPTPPPEPRRAIPQRPNIHLPSSAQQISASARVKGSEAFKRGDFTLALTQYTASLSPLPEAHTLRIVVLSNRALCNLKLGDPKSALSDCEEVLSIIGPGRGNGETIVLDGTNKDMKEFWGKTIMRKAEGLEQLEKWVDAGATWTLAVESSVGGAVATAGRRRCESALRPKTATPSSSSRPNPARRPPPPKAAKPSVDAQAVKALRQANAAADRVEDEKLALHDGVEARIGAWKAGKEGNLRALLGSLDTVLWEGAGWKKVGMGDLLMPGKCKVVYMKGISKVHPDKISQDATTEQRMISAAVFSLLNEAWDKFKAENGL